MQMSHTGDILRATCSEVGLIQLVENSWLNSSVNADFPQRVFFWFDSL